MVSLNRLLTNVDCSLSWSAFDSYNNVRSLTRNIPYTGLEIKMFKFFRLAFGKQTKNSWNTVFLYKGGPRNELKDSPLLPSPLLGNIKFSISQSQNYD